MNVNLEFNMEDETHFHILNNIIKISSSYKETGTAEIVPTVPDAAPLKTYALEENPSLFYFPLLY